MARASWDPLTTLLFHVRHVRYFGLAPQLEECSWAPVTIYCIHYRYSSLACTLCNLPILLFVPRRAYREQG